MFSISYHINIYWMIGLWNFYFRNQDTERSWYSFLAIWVQCMFIYVIVSLYQIVILRFGFCVCLCMYVFSVCVFCLLSVCICVRAYVVCMALVTSINILSVVDKHVRSYICPCRFDLITQCLWLNNMFGQQLNVM